MPAPVVGVADPFGNSVSEFRLAAEPGDIVYNVLESGNTAIILTSSAFDRSVVPFRQVLTRRLYFRAFI
jgi:putative component of toxin-antitoxin plasmid stabilization module